MIKVAGYKCEVGCYHPTVSFNFAVRHTELVSVVFNFCQIGISNATEFLIGANCLLEDSGP